MTRARRLGGLAAVGLAAATLEVHVAAVAAGVVAGLGVTTADRGTAGLAAASLSGAAAVLLLVTGLAAVGSPVAAVGTVAAAGGVAASVRAAAGGDAGGLPSAWAAVAVAIVSVMVPVAVGSGPLRSLVGARLAATAAGQAVLGVTFTIGAAAGVGAVRRWRLARRPAWPAVVGPPVLVVGLGLLVAPTLPAVGSLVAGGPAPVAAVLLVAAALALVASVLAATAGVTDARYRRRPAWLATAVGPLVLVVVLVIDAAGVLAAVLATAPTAGVAVGAALETGDRTVVTTVLGVALVALVALVVAAPSLHTRTRRVTADRPAAVGLAGLVVATSVAGRPPLAVILAGGLAVVGWLLLARRPSVPPPPRTAVSRAGVTVGAAGVGTASAAAAVRLLPRPDPGLGGLVLLAGVAVLGVAIVR